jgi:hypothetical protein
MKKNHQDSKHICSIQHTLSPLTGLFLPQVLFQLQFVVEVNDHHGRRLHLVDPVRGARALAEVVVVRSATPGADGRAKEVVGKTTLGAERSEGTGGRGQRDQILRGKIGQGSAVGTQAFILWSNSMTVAKDWTRKRRQLRKVADF